MGRLLLLMFVVFIMILVLMVVSKLLNKPSNKEDRDSFIKDLDKLAEKIKNK
jgi:hypothetical protein